MSKHILLATLTLLPTTAFADDILGDLRLGASLGVGVTGFVDSTTRDFANEGGSWEARLAFNPGRILELELGYVGAAQEIDALGLDSSALLLGTTFEGVARFNAIRGPLQPYAFMGMGWTHYSIENADTNTSAVTDSDNVAVFPVGIGLGYRIDNYLFDARATYRLTAGEDLIAPRGTEDTGLDTWSTMLRGGFVF